MSLRTSGINTSNTTHTHSDTITFITRANITTSAHTEIVTFTTTALVWAAATADINTGGYDTVGTAIASELAHTSGMGGLTCGDNLTDTCYCWLKVGVVQFKLIPDLPLGGNLDRTADRCELFGPNRQR